MIDSMLNLLDVSREERADKLGDLIFRIEDYLATIKQDDNDYRCSSLYRLCAFKGVLDVLFPESASEDRLLRSHIRNGIGTYVHLFFQNEILAKSMIIEGDWRCQWCQAEVKDSFWPGKDYKLKCVPKREHCWLYQEIEVSWSGEATGGRVILGHMDGRFKSGGRKGILDVKTVSHLTFERYLTSAPPDNVYQLQLYINLDEADFGVLLYVDLEKGNMRSFKFQRDPTVMMDAERKIRLKDDWFKTFRDNREDFAKDLSKPLKKFGTLAKTLPERECEDAQCKRAKFCPQRMTCWNTPLIEGQVKKLAGV